MTVRGDKRLAVVRPSYTTPDGLSIVHIFGRLVRRSCAAVHECRLQFAEKYVQTFSRMAGSNGPPSRIGYSGGNQQIP